MRSIFHRAAFYKVNRRLANLDLLRGLAALLVCAGHLRAFLMVHFGQITSPTILDRLFYLATGLGHQAVAVFFVLSGYLVGGSVLTAYQSGRWSWTNYTLRRMSRLWVVLLPALVLTLALDSLGRHWGHAGYAGTFHSFYNSGPAPTAPADLRATTFLGNAFFLQTILVNCLGTNGPLWSLANEFWYYALFPLLCGVWFLRAWTGRILFALLAATLIWWLPANITWLGLIWLFGAGAFWAGRREWVRRICRHPAWLICAGVLSLGSLAASKTSSSLGTDWSIGIAFSLWIIGLASCEPHVFWLKKLAAGLSEMSYTLYLVHFPLLAFVFFCFFEGRQFSPGPTIYLWFGSLLALAVAFSAAVWWCFERNTDRLRKRIERLLVRRTVPETETAA
jgi:peptidoglycan/LPS O-acetylase OafA/YrhL